MKYVVTVNGKKFEVEVEKVEEDKTLTTPTAKNLNQPSLIRE